MGRITIGIRRHPSRLIAYWFLAYSVIWTVLESSSALVPQLKPQGWPYFSAMVVVGLLIGAYRNAPPTSVHIRLKSLNADMLLEFGDIFEVEGLRVIPVNEFFDSDLGDHVSEQSLHGQLIRRYFGGNPEPFDSLVQADLRSTPGELVARDSGRATRYPIGTTALIDVRGDRFLLPALAHTNLATLKAYCDVPTYWVALCGLWSAIRDRAGGSSVTVPLIGGGLSGTGLPPTQLLQMLVLSFVTAVRQNHIASTIRVVVPAHLFSEVDLSVIRRDWS